MNDTLALKFYEALMFEHEKSQEFGELPELSNGLDYPLVFEGSQQFLDGLRRIAETFPLPLDGGADRARRDGEEADQKIINDPT